MICHLVESGEIELYFYGELDAAERLALEPHVARCSECRRALEDLAVIRSALEARPPVSTPPAGDWSGFMHRLDVAIQLEQQVKPIALATAAPTRRFAWATPVRLAAAAVLTLAATSAAFVVYSLSRGARQTTEMVSTARGGDAPAVPSAAPVPLPTPQKAFAALSEQHFERSKLVVLGLANKDARRASRADWEYERQLASSLLSDTRLYRMAAEERGMKAIANVMGDLELVLLQTAFADTSGREDLEQIQRLIQKRDLVTKMDVAASF